MYCFNEGGLFYHLITCHKRMGGILAILYIEYNGYVVKHDKDDHILMTREMVFNGFLSHICSHINVNNRACYVNVIYFSDGLKTPLSCVSSMRQAVVLTIMG